MFDELLLKKLKIGNLEPKFLEQLSTIEILLPKNILDPERTLYDLRKQLKKQKHKNKAEQKALDDAEKMILSIAKLAHQRVGQILPTEERRENRRRFVEVSSLTETSLSHAKIVSQKPLTLVESCEQLLRGNKDFKLECERYQSHHETFKAVQQYDAVVLICADARDDSSLFRDFVDNNILFLQVAGNLYDPKDRIAKAQLDSALKKLNQGGLLIVMGHAKCGAVDANAHAQDYVGKISKHVDRLVEAVDRTRSTIAHDDYEANAINQAARLAKHDEVVRKGIKLVPCLFDFTNGEEKLLRYLKDGAEPELLTSLRASGISRLKYAKDNGYTLESQYAHAIVVSDPLDLERFNDPLIMFNARLNELFAVSAHKTDISSEAIASIEYALLKVNGVKDAPHIVITHTDPAIARKLKESMLRESQIIIDKTQNGELITIMQYDQNMHAVRIVS